MRLLFIVMLAALLTGCETAWITANEVVDKLPAPTVESDTTKNRAQWVQATGYAPISLQPGDTRQQKVVMAMRASKLRAYQELVGIVHGQYIFGTTRVEDMVMQRDSFKAAVAGFVRGARVVKTYPVQDDTYATILEVDMSQLQRAWVN